MTLVPRPEGDLPPDAPPAEAAAGGRRRRNWLGWALALVILAGCLFFVDFGDIKRALLQLSAWEVAGLVLLSATERFLRGCNWALLLRMVDVRLPVLRVVRYFFQGSFSGVFLPSHVGGDILRAWWVIRDSGVKGPVIASLMVERLLGFAAALNWAILGGMVFLSHLFPARTAAWVALGILCLLALNLLLAFIASARVHGFVLRHLGRFAQSRIMRLAHDLYGQVARFSHSPRRLLLNFLFASFLQGLQMLLAMGIAVSIGAAPAMGLFFAAAALHAVILKLPIAPDGWGVGELAAITVYGLIGISAAVAFSVSAINHVIPMIALTPGFVLLLLAERDPQPIMTSRPGAEQA
jgi:uncharacterized protein (TIRG00374 family)